MTVWPRAEVLLWKKGRVYKYGNHLTPGLTEVRCYAAFFTSLLAEDLRVRFGAVPALKTM